MPPFRSGLQKRKINSAHNIEKQVDSENSDSNPEDEDLFKGELNVEGDETDSEHEEGADSDEEPDKVLYEEEDDDSTLGDDEDEGASDESSELSDSEAGDDTDETDNEDEEKIDIQVEDKREAESVIEQTQSSGSNADTATHKPNAKRKTKSDTNAAIDRLTSTINAATLTTQPVSQRDEYESGDTSDEEDRRTTVGDVPMWWYRELAHVGYDLDGRRVLRPPQRDHIDDFLKQCEDPEFWRTVRDPRTGQDVVLSAADLELLRRVRAGEPGEAGAPGEPWSEWFTRDVLAAPLRAFPDHKRSFLPSRPDQRAVSRLVHALRMGWIQTRRQLALDRRRRKEKNFYNLWGSTAEEDRLRGVHRHIAAPKRPLPAHAESYNPPPEYLLDDKETKEWNTLSETPWKRKYTFLPRRHSSLRAVPAYERFIRERFLRCLDLYLAPRAVKMRLTIAAADLVPALPAPRELQPFPTGEALVFRGHRAAVRSVDVEPAGRYAASASDDGSVRVWELATGRCVRTLQCGAAVARVQWQPGALGLLAAAAGPRLLLLAAGAGAARALRRADELLAEAPPAGAADARTAAAARWPPVSADDWARGVRVAVDLFKPVTHVAWHARGDYLVTTLHDAASRSVVVHQLSKRRSQLPFSKSKGLVQCCVFHPTKPLLFVATQRAVRVYDLVKQELVRKLLSGAQWLSSAAVHPGGDNLLLGSYDRKAVWFDLELSARPYQTLRLHGGAVRGVAFHRRYPLFASAGDDGVVVCHGMVYNDLLQNPLLVPLKRLAVPRRAALSALDLVFHPTQPWLLVAAADNTLRLYS